MLDRSACEVFITHEELAACCEYITDTVLEADTLEVRTIASNVIAALSGWTVTGVCSATVRPQGVIFLDEGGAPFASQRGGYGATWNGGGAGCLTGVPLEWPVRGITSVYVDGVLVPPNKYALVDDRYLVRTDLVSWPYWQYIERKRTELYTFEITYTFGSDIPYTTPAATSEIACDLFAGCNGAECKLPASARAVSTQGLSLDLQPVLHEVGMQSAAGEFRKVQEFLAIVNPNNQPFPTEVRSPDMPRLRKVHFFS